MRKRWTGTKSLLSVGMIAAALLVATLPARAEQKPAEPKVMVAVSIPSYDSIIGDAKYIGKLIERPGLADIIEGGIAAMTGGRGLMGLDKSKPSGFVLMSGKNELEPTKLAFLPVENLKQLITTFAPLIGPAKEGNPGVYEMNADGETVYLKQEGKWAYITTDADVLNNLPADPVKLLGDLPTSYDLSVRVNVQNIPRMYREMAIEQIRAGVDSGLVQMPEEDDDVYEIRKRAVQSQMTSIIMLINETESVTLGLNIDAEGEAVYMDLSMTGLPGSKLAKRASKIEEAKSNFSGFMSPDAAITFRATAAIGDEEDVNQAITMIEAFRGQVMIEIDKSEDLPDDTARKLIKDAVGQLLDVASATIKDGSFDGAGMVILGENSLTAAVGAQVADGAKVEQAFKNLAAVAKNDEKKFKGVKWNAVEHKGIRFHTAQIPVDEEDARKVLGDQLDVVMGIGEKSIYFAFGKEPLDALKKAIDASEAAADKVVSPLDINISIGKILTFAAAQNGDPTITAIAQMLSECNGKDHVMISLSGIKNGYRYRIEAEEGIFRAIGQASAAAAADFGGGF